METKIKIRISREDNGSDTYSIHLPTLRGMDSVFINGDRMAVEQSALQRGREEIVSMLIKRYGSHTAIIDSIVKEIEALTPPEETNMETV